MMASKSCTTPMAPVIKHWSSSRLDLFLSTLASPVACLHQVSLHSHRPARAMAAQMLPTDIEYSLELFGNAVHAVLEQESISKAILIGHSLGGCVATMVLRLFPAKVKAIVYVDSFFNPPENYMSHAQRKAVAERHADDDKFRAFLDVLWTAKSTDAIKAQVVKTMMGTSKYVRCNASTTTAQPHMWRWDEVYEVPALLIVQPMFFNMTDKAWLRHIPRLETRLWEENGHFLFMEDPQRFNGEVEGWLIGNSLV